MINVLKYTVLLVFLFVTSCQGQEKKTVIKKEPKVMKYAVEKSETEWKEQLGPDRYRILR